MVLCTANFPRKTSLQLLEKFSSFVFHLVLTVPKFFFVCLFVCSFGWGFFVFFCCCCFFEFFLPLLFWGHIGVLCCDCVYVSSHVYGHTGGSRKLKSGVVLESLSTLFTKMVSLSPFPASLPDSSPGGSSISVSMCCGYRQLPFLPGFYMGPGNPHTYRAHVLSMEPSPQPMRLFCFGF